MRAMARVVVDRVARRAPSRRAAASDLGPWTSAASSSPRRSTGPEWRARRLAGRWSASAASATGREGRGAGGEGRGRGDGDGPRVGRVASLGGRLPPAPVGWSAAGDPPWPGRLAATRPARFGSADVPVDAGASVAAALPAALVGITSAMSRVRKIHRRTSTGERSGAAAPRRSPSPAPRRFRAERRRRRTGSRSPARGVGHDGRVTPSSSAAQPFRRL